MSVETVMAMIHERKRCKASQLASWIGYETPPAAVESVEIFDWTPLGDGTSVQYAVHHLSDEYGGHQLRCDCVGGKVCHWWLTSYAGTTIAQVRCDRPSGAGWAPIVAVLRAILAC